MDTSFGWVWALRAPLVPPSNSFVADGDLRSISLFSLQISIELLRHAGLCPVLLVEWPLDFTPPPTPDFFPERLDRIHSLLLADPTEPPVPSGDVSHLVGMDNLHYRHSFHVAASPELFDGRWANIKTSSLVHEVEDGKPRSQRMVSVLGRLPDTGVNGK